MQTKIETGIPEPGCAVRSFIDHHAAAQLYHSATWCRTILNEAGGEAHNVVVRGGAEEVLAWMPLFVRRGPSGPVINSSPFFGSHGGILAVSEEAFSAAAAAAFGFVRDIAALGFNIVEPLDTAERAAYHRHFSVAATVARVGNVKRLTGLDSHETLYATLSGLTRSNLKRRCWRHGITVERDASDKAIGWMLQHHAAQMEAKNAPPKTLEFFRRFLLNDSGDGVGARFYLARHEGRPVGGLFLCTWRDWVEYITPVFDLDYRNLQPLSAVIFEAMLDCARDGFVRWNFGGSGDNLAGVKAFKEAWGGDNVAYHYHNVDTGRLAELTDYVQAHGTAGYRGYYLYPLAPR